MNQSTIELLIIFAKSAVIFFGILITYLSLKAYRRTHSRPLRDLSIGFGVVTIGAALGGVANQVFGVAFSTGVLIQSLLTALGFAIITYSMYAE